MIGAVGSPRRRRHKRESMRRREIGWDRELRMLADDGGSQT
jgi:hypothetical protein